MFRSTAYKKFWADATTNKLFMKYRVGDATLHGAVLDLFTTPDRVIALPKLPYAHNSNDFSGYPPKKWRDECGTLTAVVGSRLLRGLGASPSRQDAMASPLGLHMGLFDFLLAHTLRTCRPNVPSCDVMNSA